MHSKKKKVILLDHEGQVKNCLKRIKNMRGEKLLIALSPFAMHELDRRNFSYKILEDYHDRKELYKIGINNFRKVENICGMIDNSIHDACPQAAEAGVTPAMFNFVGIRSLYDNTTARLFQLFKLIDAETPAAILAYAGKDCLPITGLEFGESVHARLLALLGWDAPIKILPHIPYPEDSQDTKKTYQKFKGAMWWLQRHPKLFDLAAEYHRHGWRGLFGRLKSLPRAGKNVQALLFGQAFNWDYCREELQSAGIDPIFHRVRDDLEYWMSGQFSNGVDIDALSNAWEELRKNDKFREFFIWDNIDFFPALEDYLRFLVERLTPACLNAYEKTYEILRKRRIKVFLSSGFPSCTSHSAARAARDLSIPVVVWQHGPIGLPSQIGRLAYRGAYGLVENPSANCVNLMSNDVLFLFEEVMVDKFAKPAKRFGVRLVPVGSPSLEAVSPTPQPNKIKKVKKIVKLDPRKKVVVWVLPPLLQTNASINTYPPQLDPLRWRVQRAVLDVFGKHSDYTVIVKLKPTRARDPPVGSYIREKGFENCQIVKGECALTDLLQIADLVMLMYPGMALLESLMTTKPIFYTGDRYLDTKAQKLLERRAYCYQELKNLTNDLDRYLSAGKIDKEVDLNDKEFIKFYGISSAGRGSGVRGAKALQKIIGGT